MLDRFPAYIIRLEMHDLQRNNIQWRKKMMFKEAKIRRDLNENHTSYEIITYLLTEFSPS
jgi:hypothetical protein